MKFGMNLLLWTAHVTTDHFPVIAKLKQAGFDGVELPLFEGDAAHYKTIRKELDTQGLRSTAVTVATPDANPISADAATRKAALARLKWAIEMTATLGGEVLCGPYHSPLAVFSGAGPTEEEKKRAAEVLYQAADLAAKSHVKLAIEYLNRFECYFLTTAADARALFEQAVQSDPNRWDPHAYLAEMLVSSGDLAGAYPHLVKMEEIDSNSVVGNYLMAEYWYQCQDFERARAYAEKVKASRPANSELRALLGDIYTELGEKQKASEEYREAIQLAPERADLRERLRKATGGALSNGSSQR